MEKNEAAFFFLLIFFLHKICKYSTNWQIEETELETLSSTWVMINQTNQLYEQTWHKDVRLGNINVGEIA